MRNHRPLVRLLAVRRQVLGIASYVIFALGAAVVSSLVLVLKCLPIRSKSKQAASRWCVQRLFAAFIRLLCRVGLVAVRVEHMERLLTSKGMIIANHPSLLDVVFLMGWVRQANCVIKGKIFNNVLTGLVVRTAGYVPNHDSASMMALASERIRSSERLIIFPEGTRTTLNQPRRLQKGAARIALASEASVTPVYIDCTPLGLTKEEKWYKVPPCRLQFTFCVGEPLDLNDIYTGDAQDSVKVRRITGRFNDWFNQMEAHHEQRTGIHHHAIDHRHSEPRGSSA